jgi:hypothetical protein
MIKWFFLTSIVLIFAAMNAAAFGNQLSFDAQVFAVIAVNVFVVSLLAIWLGSYFPTFEAYGFLVFGHAALILSAGIGFIGLGLHGLIMGTCGYLINDQNIPGLISRLGALAQESKACSLLLFSFVIFGLLMSWPSLKLFYDITRRSRGTR